MTGKKIEEIIQQGEGIDVEFKTSHFELNRNAFETICAFLNRNGGHLILGVRDDGSIEGVSDESTDDIVNSIITNANNPQKLQPPFYLSTQIVEIKDKKLIYVFVPESSPVHSTNGKIFNRNQDGDLNITNQPELVSLLYLRKQTTYTENRIFPYAELSDFKRDLFIRVRVMAKNERADHPWQHMTDMELLHSAGLFKHDY